MAAVACFNKLPLLLLLLLLLLALALLLPQASGAKVATAVREKDQYF
jgi:hypothetical protein